MRRVFALLLTVAIGATCSGQVTSKGVAEVANDVASKIEKVSSFSATVETSEEAQGSIGQKTTADLKVSRLYGWKLNSAEGPEPYIAVTDFQTFYQYFPKDKRVMKTTADEPELKAMLTKPVTDMNPLKLLDQQSLVFHGTEEFMGETVYHVEGTTESQLMPGGPTVKRTLSAWVSVEDGLPRKTVESVATSTGTTVYRDVKVNPELTPADFAFTPPDGVTLIDTNEQIKRMERQMRKPAGTPAPPL